MALARRILVLPGLVEPKEESNHVRCTSTCSCSHSVAALSGITVPHNHPPQLWLPCTTSNIFSPSTVFLARLGMGQETLLTAPLAAEFFDPLLRILRTSSSDAHDIAW